LCCCVTKSMATAQAGPENAVTISCCCDAAACDADGAPAQEGNPEGCGDACCIKAPPSVDSWTPPVDDIGVSADWPVVATATPAAVTESQIRRRTKAPPPGPWGASAPPLRHATILQV
jgi:hypothetical protein